MRQMKSSNLDLRDLFDKKIVVVGKKTKDVLMQYGIIADLMPEEAGEINLSELMKQKVDAKDVVWWRKIKKSPYTDLSGNRKGHV